MPSASITFSSTTETTNYARLCRLLVDVGSQALRDTFDKIHPPAGLHGVLAPLEHSMLQPLRKKRVLNATQWGKLYPAIPSSVTSANFDVTLLILLLRNICGLTPPATGWDSLPPAADTSIEANIARIRHYRNHIYAHASQASVDDQTFNTLWQDISNALVGLGGASYAAPINKLKTDSMDPDIEEHYQELLKEWKKDDESTKDKLEGLEEMIKKLQKDEDSTKNKLGKIEDNIGVKLERMKSGLEDNIRGTVEQMKSGLEDNIRGTLEQMKEIKDILEASAAEDIDEDNIGVKLERMKIGLEENIRGTVDQMKSELEDNIRDTVEQMKSELEDSIRGTLEQIKDIKDILAASAAENIDEVKGRDDLEQMKSEILGNISEQLDTLTTGMLVSADNIIDKFEQTRTEMENMRGKLDTLRTVAEEKKDEGDFDPVNNINQIRQLYISREGWLAPFPWCEEFHFHLNDIFTRLVMITKEKKARGTGTRNVVDTSAIFQPHEECPKPRTVLIEGNPGMGKTTYCNKVAYDWATEKRKAGDCFPDFQLVLSLKCRDIGMESDLWEAIDDQLLPREIQEDERKQFVQFIRQNQSSVLLVLDGLDELPSSKLPEFSEIIQGRLLPGCHLVATARHEAGIPVRKVCDTLLEIEGFTQEDAKEFIAKYFKTKENLAKKLLHQLENDENLQEMVANPLNTALLCLLCEDFQGIPQRRTQLYLEIVQCVLRRYRKKNGLLVNSDDLIEVYKGPLKHLGSIALSGLLEDNMYFADKQLGSHTRELPGFGFLSVQPGSSKRRPCVCYGFLHKSFQELFAAFYICCQLLSEEISPEILVANARYFREWKQVLLFTCGMLAVESEETAVALMKRMANEVNKDELTKAYFPVAIECIKECKKEESDFHVELASTFGSCLKVHTVDLSKQNSGDACAAVLGLALKTNTTVTELDLPFNNLGSAGAEALANVLNTNKTLTKLNLSHNNLGPAGAEALAAMLNTNKTLTELNVCYNHLDTTGAEALATMLKTNTTLTKLDLSRNNLGPAGAEALANVLQTNTALSELDLSSNDLGPVGAEAIATMLKTNTTLTKLDLFDNDLGPAGAEVLATMLKTNTTLTKLNLFGNNLDTADAALVADALYVNSTLTVLNLYANDVSEPFLKKLKEAHGDRVRFDFNFKIREW